MPSLTDRLADLQTFEQGFLAVDQSFSASARDDARRRFEKLKGNAEAMSEAEFDLAIAEIAALTDNAHSKFYAAHWAAKFDRLGVRFYIADDGIFVADALPHYENLIGRNVTAIAGHTLTELRATWDRYENGTEGQRDQTLYFFVESPAVMHAAGLAASAEALVLTFANGERVRVQASADWEPPEGIWSIVPQAREIELSRAGRIKGTPLYLQEPESFYRVVGLAELDAVYLQFRANVDFNREIDLREATRKTLNELRQQKPQYVIVDQRFNLGGDLNTTRDLMQGLAEVVGATGRVFVITSGRTFSAGISSVGYLKQSGRERVTIVGRPLGDHLEFWAEGRPIELAQSGAHVGVATERHNYVTGCPESDCHDSIRRHPIKVRTLAPDFQPAVLYADVVSGRDPDLEYIEAQIRAAKAGQAGTALAN